MSSPVSFIVSKGDEKFRLDIFLSSKMPSSSRSQIKNWIKSARILVDGRKVKPGSHIQRGQCITVEPPQEKEALVLAPEEGTIPFLYEDEHILVIDKPSGLLSHPNPGSCGGSILNVLLKMGVVLKGGEEPMRQGLVHRLDRETSGVLILSKNEEAFTHLKASFLNREVKKIYNAIVRGRLKKMEFTRTNPICRDPKQRNYRMVHPEGRPAETRFKLLHHYADDFALFEARPLTGRTHQVRIHLSYMGTPVIGDHHYASQCGVNSHLEGVNRLMLHCCEMTIKHPVNDEEITFKSPHPEDFKELLKRLEPNKGSVFSKD